ncbi:Capsule assembly protein Wzi [Pedobacter antarcticus]|uniref:Capsule assembly protein Wzi n=1 Tax=Pedobacter antarcticus TaxID=34086 RepID=A0A1I2G6Y7_9SPHI|nr:capsule assembly Wzi family protein [Pedobacter antarcticus]SFF12760.1 Capsule assembly protein Wzi [Pedobacter antarcticus]
MNKIYKVIFAIGLSVLAGKNAYTQTVPVGTPGLEDYYRRQQLLGKLDSSVSFSIRPLMPSVAFKVRNVFDPDSSLVNEGITKSSGHYRFANGHGEFQVLPFTWQNQFNSHHPYGWNDGAMIPARGYQTMVSGGFYAKIGPLTIQLRPEYVYAQNRSFDGFAEGRSDAELSDYYTFYNKEDSPERFGNGSYNKLFWGQSSIRLNAGPMSLGLSNENLWWGPGRRNSIMMTNNAPGFKHLTLNTIKPIRTPIGSFEMQVIAGKLENSGFTPLNVTANSTGRELFKPYRDDERYLTGFNINYQPKWIPGLFLGFTRDFMSYYDDLNGFKDYFPFFTPVQKVNSGIDGDPFDRDQRLSFYARWLFPKAHAEVYFEYGVNDNAYNLRDFAGSPEHSRSYIFGFSKMIPLKLKKDEFIEVNAEINQMSQTVDRLVRPAGGFYQHYQIRQGYTNLGQVLGAGTGSGGNLQSFDINWVKGLKSIGFGFERFEHNADFYEEYIEDLNSNSRRWVDFAFAAKGTWNYKNLIFNAKLQGIKSLNYQWKMKDPIPGGYYIPNNDVFNFHGELGLTYRF